MIFLREAESCLHFRHVLDNFAVQFAAFLDQTLLRFVGFFQGAMEFLVFYAESFEAFIADNFLKDFLEVAFQCFKVAAVKTEILCGSFLLAGVFLEHQTLQDCVMICSNECRIAN